MDSFQPPCPARIIDDTGGAFAMGAIGGSAYYGFKGYRNAPKGARLAGSLSMIKLRAPVIGGNFAVWGFLFSTFDCTYAHLRKRDDPWNSIMSGATTGGILALRAGWKATATNAVIGGVLLALIEGMGYGIQRMLPQPEHQQQTSVPPPLRHSNSIDAAPSSSVPPVSRRALIPLSEQMDEESLTSQDFSFDQSEDLESFES